MPDVAGLAERRLAGERTSIDRALEALCARYLDAVEPTVAEAIRYSLLGGGKRLRGILLGAAYRAAGGVGDPSELAAAVEIVHAYSLVHDALPCMDDDDVRRGRPTVHRAFGVGAATAAGLTMVPLAALAAYDAACRLGLAPRDAGRVVAELMSAAGAGGMIGGQLLDLEAEGLAPSLDELERIHRLKTGALIAASVRLGGLAARASDAGLAALGRYGAAVGLAFQIADDVLDVTGTADQLGKAAGRDAARRKHTYPSILGVDASLARAADLAEQACTALAQADLLTPALDHLAHYAVARQS